MPYETCSRNRLGQELLLLLRYRNHASMCKREAGQQAMDYTSPRLWTIPVKNGAAKKKGWPSAKMMGFAVRLSLCQNAIGNDVVKLLVHRK